MISSPSPPLSIVIPAYNESGRLPSTLEQVRHYLSSQPFSGEVVVVDDGSDDGTPDVARRCGAGMDLRVLSSNHQGKGGAVRHGMLAARGDAILMTDADLCTPLEDAGRLLDALRNGVEVAIGSRALPGSVLEVRQPRAREWMGRTGNKIIQAVLLPGLHDTQCGFKLFERNAAREIFSRSVMNRWSFDIEVLYLARKLGYRIREVPVHWSHRSGSKVNVARDYLGVLRDLWTIRRIHRTIAPVTRPVEAARNL